MNNQTDDVLQDSYARKWQLAAGCATIFIMLVGVIGNLLTIIALLRYPRIRNVTAAFIISLCVADCLFCGIVLPFNSLRFFDDSWTEIDLLCNVIPFLQYGNVGLSLLFIAMITINRYVMIAHYHVYNKLYRPVNVALMIIFCFIFSFGMQLPTLLGIWGEYKAIKELRTCSISKDKRGYSSKTTLFMMGFVVPCVIIIACYTRIFWVVHNSEKKMRQHSKKGRSSATRAESKAASAGETSRKRNEWRITKMVLAIFLSFLVCYLPITVVKVIDRKAEHITWHLVSYLMLYMSACINPIIYVIMNKQYRKAYSNVLQCRPANFFSYASARPKEQPTKTVISQVSVSMVPMNAIDGQRIESTKL